MRGFRWAKEQAADRCALVLVHGRSGNPPKDMTYAQIRAVVAGQFRHGCQGVCPRAGTVGLNADEADDPPL